MNENLKNRIKAFSLAEMMIVMLVVSILTAAMMPILTRYIQNSSNRSTDPIWGTSGTDQSDIYFRNFGTSGAQVLIGETSESAVNSNLVINSSDTPAQMLILTDGGPQFELGMSASGIALGLSDYVSGGGLAIGPVASAQGLYSVATTAGSANGLNAVSIGNKASAAGDYAVAIGNSATASSSSAVAIGSGASAGSNGTAIGEGATATGSYSVALGNAPTATGENSVALGYPSNATGSYSVAIGQSASASQNYTTVIGSSSVAATTANSTVLSGSTINLDATTITLSGTQYSSDRRLKNLKGPFTAGLESIDRIQPYNYTFKKDKRKTPYVGVMAQDLQKVFPNAVTKIDKKGHLGIRQDEMFYCMINSVKQLYASFKSILVKLYGIEKGLMVCEKTEEINPKLINELEQQNNALSIKNQQLKRRLALLEKKVK